MDLVTDPVELVRRYHAFVYGPNVPAEAKDALQTIPGTSADIITQGREILYAHYDLLNDEGRAVLGLFAQYAVSQGWTTENADGRCEKIVAAVRRDLGEKGKFPKAESDPEPQTARRAGNIDFRHPDQAATPAA